MKGDAADQVPSATTVRDGHLDVARLPDFSVVIATLGGPTLSETVECLLASECTPREILICIPEQERSRVDGLQAVPRVRIISTRARGQVVQRAAGFAEATGELVLQCDDDVSFPPSVIGSLIGSLVALGRRHVVGPVFCCSTSRAPLGHFAIGLRGSFANLYFHLAAGLPWGKGRLGRFSSTTCAISVDPAHVDGAVVDVDWLAGGFVLGWKEDLIGVDFYPFPGKAYCEDLLHARERARMGLAHHVVIPARVFIEAPPENPDIAELKRELLARYRISRRIGASAGAAATFLLLEGIRRLVKATLRGVRPSKRP